MEEKFSSELVAQYEDGIRQSLPVYDQLFTMIQSLLRIHLTEEANVLVVGAGGGKELATWGSQNKNWTLTGVDPSVEMMKLAKIRVTDHSLNDRVNLIEGTVNDLPSTTQFDAATCILVLHFLHDPTERLNLVKTIFDQLKPGAPFVLVSKFGDPQSTDFQVRMNMWKSFWLDAGVPPEQVEEIVSGVLDFLSFQPEEKIITLLEDAGFVKITRFFTVALFGGWIGFKSY